MRSVAKRMELNDPGDPQWTLSWAYATWRTESIETARLSWAIWEAANARLKRTLRLEEGFAASRSMMIRGHDDEEDLRYCGIG